MSLKGKIAGRTRRRLKREPVVLLVLLVIAAGIWGFVELADEMSEGDTHAFDAKLIVAMRNPQDFQDPLGPKWLEELGRDFTALGSMGILSVFSLAAAGFLFLHRKWRTALFLLAAVSGGYLLSFGLKAGFDRPRPDLVAHGAYVVTTSFPSSHAMMSAVTYLTLGALLAYSHPRRLVKVYLIFLSLSITLMVGISRVYLGVHWPTDVLAGWALGASWALLCWLLARWLRKCTGTEENGDGRPHRPVH